MSQDLPELGMLSSSEAAKRLGVEPGRVRVMIRDGILAARKVGGRWLLDPGSVERRRRARVSEGRPYTPANAWALIDLWHGGNAPWVSRWERSRLKRRIRLQGIHELAPALRNRANVWRLRGHPAALRRVRENESVLLGGVSAASHYDADILASGEVEVYASSGDAEALVRDLYLEHSLSPNVLLHVVPGSWPFDQIPEHAPGAVPPLVVALDLSEAGDARSRRAGKELLDRLTAERDSRDPNPWPAA